MRSLKFYYTVRLTVCFDFYCERIATGFGVFLIPHQFVNNFKGVVIITNMFFTLTVIWAFAKENVHFWNLILFVGNLCDDQWKFSCIYKYVVTQMGSLEISCVISLWF